MLFGTPHVFSISDRMKAVLHQVLQLDHQPEVGLQLKCYLGSKYLRALPEVLPLAKHVCL